MNRVPGLALGTVGLALLLTAAHSANDGYANLLPVFLPALQERFGLREVGLASLVAVISVSSNVLQPFFGAIADAWGRRRSAAIGLVAGSLLMTLVPVASSVPLLVGLLAVGGLGSALFHPAAVSLAHAIGRRKGLIVGFFTAGGPLGSAVAPIAVLFVVREFGSTFVPALAAVGLTLALLLVALMPRGPSPSSPRRGRWLEPRLFFGPVGVLALAGILRSLSFISVVNAKPILLVSQKGFAVDAPVIGWTLSLYNASAAAGVLLAGTFEARIGRRRLVVYSMLAALPLLFASLYAVPGTALFAAVVFLAGLLSNASVPILVVTAQDLAPQAIATASGMLLGFTWGMAGVLYIAFGGLQEVIGIAPGMAISFLFILPAAWLAHSVFRSQGERISSS
ncbi:MAG: MFS transporter [Trueperaceae bacterium]|nr:MAG: MFS transporter [Trueperaceae bacterium]